MAKAEAGRWVLVADDDSRVRAAWSAALTRAGHRVLTAGTGREALDLMRTFLPHLIVLDLRMPEMSGPNLLKVFLDVPVLRQIPVLVVSGFLDEHAELLRTNECNVVGGLEKPVTGVQLVQAVAKALAAAAHRGRGPRH